jgi:hypothetical protein
MGPAANARPSSSSDEPAAPVAGADEPAGREELRTGRSERSPKERPAGLGAAIGAVIGGYRKTAAATTDLAVAEAGLAVASLVRIAKVTALLALFFTTGWVLATFAIAALTAPIFGWPAALGALAAAHFLLALLCRLWIRRLQPHLGFPVLRTALAEIRRPDGDAADEADPS